MAANFVAFKSVDVPQAELGVDNECNKLEDVDVELFIGGADGEIVVCNGS